MLTFYLGKDLKKALAGLEDADVDVAKAVRDLLPDYERLAPALKGLDNLDLERIPKNYHARLNAYSRAKMSFIHGGYKKPAATTYETYVFNFLEFSLPFYATFGYHTIDKTIIEPELKVGQLYKVYNGNNSVQASLVKWNVNNCTITVLLSKDIEEIEYCQRVLKWKQVNAIKWADKTCLVTSSGVTLLLNAPCKLRSKAPKNLHWQLFYRSNSTKEFVLVCEGKDYVVGQCELNLEGFKWAAGEYMIQIAKVRDGMQLTQKKYNWFIGEEVSELRCPLIEFVT